MLTNRSVELFHCLVGFALAAAFSTSVPARAADPPAAIAGVDHVRVLGDVAVDHGVITAKGPKAALVIGADDADMYRVTVEVKPAELGRRVFVQIMSADPGDTAKQAVLYAGFYRDQDRGRFVSDASQWDSTTQQWTGANDVTWYTYWPAATDAATLALVEGSGIAPRTLDDHWFTLRIEADRLHVRYWLDGLLVRQVECPAEAKGPVSLLLAQGDRARLVTVSPLADSPYLPVDLTLVAHERPAAPLGKSDALAGGVPFELAAGGLGLVDLRKAHWIEQKQDPLDTYERYEGGPPVLDDPRMPLLRVPASDYIAAHVLAVADDDPATTPNFTLRAGRYGFSEQVVFHSFPGTVPRNAEAANLPDGDRLDTPFGPFVHVRVPLGEAFAQDLDRWMEIELTKEVRLARRQPDPCRIRSRPLGPASGVRIAALTLERSPLQMRVRSKEPGHAFVVPQRPTFDVRLTNLTAAELPYELSVRLTHRDGTQLELTQRGTVAAYSHADASAEAAAAKLGNSNSTGDAEAVLCGCLW
jgi:hypothetical protein